MKFGKLIELRAVPEWREKYLSYKKLKRITKTAPSEGESPTAARRSGPSDGGAAVEAALLTGREAALQRMEAAFFALLEDDLRRINEHAVAQSKLVAKRVAVLEQQLASLTTTATPSASSYLQRASRVDVAVVTATYCDCARLRSFVQLNQEGIRKIVKKLDKVSGGAPRQPVIVARLASEPFAAESSSKALDEWMAALEAAVGHHPEALLRMRADAKLAISSQSASADAPRPWAIGLAAVAAAAVAQLSPYADPHDEHVHARRCLCVLTAVIIAWLTVRAAPQRGARAGVPKPEAHSARCPVRVPCSVVPTAHGSRRRACCRRPSRTL